MLLNSQHSIFLTVETCVNVERTDDITWKIDEYSNYLRWSKVKANTNRLIAYLEISKETRGRHGLGRMVVEFTTTSAISVYHH
jgi:hypothetical protein